MSHFNISAVMLKFPSNTIFSNSFVALLRQENRLYGNTFVTRRFVYTELAVYVFLNLIPNKYFQCYLESYIQHFWRLYLGWYTYQHLPITVSIQSEIFITLKSILRNHSLHFLLTRNGTREFVRFLFLLSFFSVFTKEKVCAVVAVWHYHKL